MAARYAEGRGEDGAGPVERVHDLLWRLAEFGLDQPVEMPTVNRRCVLLLMAIPSYAAVAGVATSAARW
jgi:hypothetical protein